MDVKQGRTGPVLLTVLALTAAALVVSAGPPAVPTRAVSPPGTPVAWGSNLNGQLGDNTTSDRLAPVAVAALSSVTSMASGSYHGLALRSDGTVAAWGDNSSGQLGDNTTTERDAPVQVAGAAGVGVLSGVIAIAAGSGHSLALKSDGTVWAWGENSTGQLGDNSLTQRSVPVQVKGPGGAGTLATVVGIAAGDSHSLAVKSDGTVWTWGYNQKGQLGDTTLLQRSTPVQVTMASTTTSTSSPLVYTALTGITTVAAGAEHSLALKSDGTVWAWGYNGYGQLGDQTTANRNQPVQVGALTFPGAPAVTAIAAGGHHNIAIRSDGTVWAWGRNSSGQLGNNTTTESHGPVLVMASGSGVDAIAAGFEHSLALKSDGTVWAWGRNTEGQLGDNTTSRRLAPSLVRSLGSVTAVVAGGKFSLAITNGTFPVPVVVTATGNNGFGALGNGTTQASAQLVNVARLSDAVATAAGQYHSLALKSDGTVWAWGINANGQLGDNTTTNRQVPVQVVGPGGAGILTGIIAIAAGEAHSLALKSDGSVWAWGYNAVGQLGDNTTVDRYAPVQVLGAGAVGTLTGVTAIVAGDTHNLARDSFGTVWAWGNNSSGQLGDNTTTNRRTPVHVTGSEGTGTLSGVASRNALGAGFSHSVVLKFDGTVWAWGNNGNGQLGYGGGGSTSAPVQVGTDNDSGPLDEITAVAAGYHHSLALESDGTMWAWGYNSDGQLGDNTTTDGLAADKVKAPGGAGTLTSVSAIAAGYHHSLALKTDGTVWGFGDNSQGELGDTTTTDRRSPAQMVGIGGATFLATGSTANHALVVVPTGQLRVTTNPAVASQISVDGRAVDSWGLTWLHLSAGTHTVHFSHIEGFTEPADQTVKVAVNGTTVVDGVFTPRASLRVITSPAVPAAISVDGFVVDDWGSWTDVPPGAHQVCFGQVAGFDPPGCQNVNTVAGALSAVTGTYVANPTALGAPGKGMLRVTTSPALPSQISLNGHIADSWGLTWPELAPGSYLVHFSHVEGFTEPPDQTVNVAAGNTTTVVGTFTQRGSLRVITGPAVAGTVLVNGVPVNDWGSWTDRPVGPYAVCFVPLIGYATTPACQTATLTAGTLMTITGNYS